ncbi:MAG: hypothetical protein BWY70_01477 [Bacteroidetes bacterium ADurb.Bin408]|nr:MAG: hypothetical protein BWY70_01477 [Bacteroidetes bacterium ADurb.Bin408]
MVSKRSFLFSMVRVAIIAGTLQPKPMISGINDLPCKPILCMSLSIINTARAIYPVSSISEIKKNSSKILGRKTTTPPTPLMMPLISRSVSAPGGRRCESVDASHSKPDSIHIMGYSPKVKVSVNVSHINKKKTGYPR